MIHLGTEDIVAQEADPERLTDDIVLNIGTVVTALRTKNPDVQIVLARIIPVRGKEQAVAIVHRKTAPFAKAQSTPRSPLVADDPADGSDPSSGLADDGIRPNTAGANHMADAIAKATHTLINR